MRCIVDLPAFELNRTYYEFTSNKFTAVYSHMPLLVRTSSHGREIQDSVLFSFSNSILKSVYSAAEITVVVVPFPAYGPL